MPSRHSVRIWHRPLLRQVLQHVVVFTVRLHIFMRRRVHQHIDQLPDAGPGTLFWLKAQQLKSRATLTRRWRMPATPHPWIEISSPS